MIRVMIVDDQALIREGLNMMLGLYIKIMILTTFNEEKLEELTPREKEIAMLVEKGKTNKEISEELYITEGTVKNHITRILDKLELRDRTQLAIYIKEM